MRPNNSEPLVVRTASSATTAAKLVRPIAASTRTGLRGSRASRYRPNHQLSAKTTADSAAIHLSVARTSFAVAAVSRRVIAQRTQEVDAPELRPVGLGEPHLRVRALPEQEPGQPLLPRRADHQIGVGLPRRVEVLRDGVGSDGLDQLLAGGAFGQLLAEQPPHRVHDLLAAAVADRDVDVEAAAVAGGR